MSAYVDKLRPVAVSTVKDKQARQLTAKHGMWCHLLADTDEELYRFAARIGMKLGWVQKRGTAEIHFDLIPTRRQAAINLGAQEITDEEIVALLNRKREARKQLS
jgi:uncharacterized protein (UPF0261 family)